MKTLLIILCILCASQLRAQTWTPNMQALAVQTESQYGLPHGICRAFALTESTYDSTATREENHYFNDGSKYSQGVKRDAEKFLAAHPTYETSLTLERAQRTISVGLFQFMGQLLRDLGYDAEEINPSVVQQFHYFGLFVVKNKSRWPNMKDWIAAYNAGSPRKINGQYVNQGYVNKVVRNLQKFSY